MVDPSVRQRARELFELALQVPPGNRMAWLAVHASADAAVEREVRTLLESHEDAADFLAEPPVSDVDLEEPPGTHIGRFILQKRIGEGGFGDIYLAEQHEPIRRRVALKIIKPGMDSREVLKRFAAERQTLAMLNHPGIARIIDAGVTATARPYFVMELVEGPRITLYCDEHRLPIRARVELFLSVCDAVQHAHQQGVIHRDLKPANVLVCEQEGKPAAKVIDFGIAKLLRPEPGGDSSLMTIKPHWLGTPAYMSPEQMLGQPVDTRSDVWSLGALLHELLCGKLPIDPQEIRDKPTAEVEQKLREVESSGMTRRMTGDLTQIAAARAASTAPLLRALRGELEWIVGRCLRTAREERYPGASALADDLRAWLAGAAVQAAPPSRWYQLRKSVARHKLAFLTGTTATLGLLVALAGTSYGLIREQRIAAELVKQKNEAEAQRNEADRRRIEAEEMQQTVEAVNAYLSAIFRQANPQFAREWKKDMTLRDALDSVAQILANDLASQKLVRAEVCATISQAYVSLGEAKKGLPLARLAVEIRQKTLGPEHPKTMSARYNLGYLLSGLGDYEEATAIFEETLAYSQRVNGPDDPITLSEMHQLGFTWMSAGKTAEAEPLLRDALERKQRVLGREHRSTLTTANVLATLFQNTGRHAEAEKLSRETLEIRQRVLGVEHPSTLTSMVNLSSHLLSLGRTDEAIAMIEDGLERSLRIVDKDHQTTRGFVRNKAIWLIRTGRPDEGVKLIQQYGYDISLLDKHLAAASQPVR